MDGIESVRKNSQVDAQHERKVATNGQRYFSLKATNGQSLGKSEMYGGGNAAMENGIASVRKTRWTPRWTTKPPPQPDPSHRHSRSLSR